MVLTISDPGLLGARTIQRTFLQNIVLGRRDNTGSFIGKMTGFSVQEYAGAFTRLQSESDCLRRSTNMELGNIFLLELGVAWDIFGVNVGLLGLEEAYKSLMLRYFLRFFCTKNLET